MSRHINLIFEDKVYVGGNSCDGSEETIQPCVKSNVDQKQRRTRIVVVIVVVVISGPIMKNIRT